ncbi:MAG: hypothetical protein ACOVOR_03090 [Rhabdochlamydiaceae bacterium]
MKLNTKIPFDLLSFGDNTIFLFSSLLLRRNISHFPFTHKLSKNQAVLLTEKIVNAHAEKKFLLFDYDHWDIKEKEYFLEHLFNSHPSIFSYPPKHVFIHPEDKSILYVKGEDHLHIQFFAKKLEELNHKKNHLIDLERRLQNTLSFTFSERFGYLTALPQYCGTAFSISIYLHLPLSLSLDPLKTSLKANLDEGVCIQDLENNQTDLGHIVILFNQYTLGLNEDEIVSRLYTSALKLITKEEEQREEILKTENPHVKDMVARAFGLLKHSYELEIKETIQSLSLIKLGVELSWIKNIDLSVVNDLFFHAQNAHLATYLKKEEQKVSFHERALFIHDNLKTMTLEEDLIK